MPDRAQLLQQVAALAANFNREADRALFLAYEMGLADLPPVDIERAIHRAIRESKFMPSVAELRELAGVVSPADRATKAWAIFERAVVEHGYVRSVAFDDPVINATVRNLGGWEACCEKGGEEFDKWLRKDFERVYASSMRSGVSADAARPLIGFIERTNRFGGYPENIPPPQLIACDLPPHREGVVTLPAPEHRQSKLLADAAAAVGRPIDV